MAKSWNAKKSADRDLDEIFDELLLTSNVKESQKQDVPTVAIVPTSSSSEWENEESSDASDEVLFCTPKAPKSYSVRPKKVQVTRPKLLAPHPLDRPPVTSTPRPAKAVTVTESEKTRERSTSRKAQKYFAFRKLVKYPAEPSIDSVTSYKATSSDTITPDFHPNLDHVSIRSKNNKVQRKSPKTVDLVPESITSPLGAIGGIPLSQTPHASRETSPCTDFPDPEASAAEYITPDRNFLSLTVSEPENSPPSLNTTQFLDFFKEAVQTKSVVTKSIANHSRSEPRLTQTSSVVPKDDVSAPGSPVSVPDVDFLGPEILKQLSTETSPLPGLPQLSLQEGSCREVESTEDHELNSTLVAPIAGKKYRYSLALSDYVRYRPSEGGFVHKIPQKAGRRSSFALHGLLPGADASRKKRQTIMVQVPLPSEMDANNEEEEELGSPEDRVLSYCDSSEIQSFSAFVTRQMGKNVTKVGEGVYGEVFAMKVGRNQRVVKIIPIGGEELCNGEPQKKFQEVLSELTISKALSDLGCRTDCQNWTENFATLTNVCVVQGEYPEVLLDCWDAFDIQEGSQNWRPEFPHDQRYLILGLAHAGQALEIFKLKKEAEALSIFLQVACTLAVAEVQWEFEHRDLHVGNILLKSTRKKKVAFLINGESIEVPCYGPVATIIDFTLSRAQIHSHLVFCDLQADEGLFQGNGDYQFDIYRLMREHNRNDWRAFCPVSNVFWLHYLGKKLLEKLKSVSSVEPSNLPLYVDAVLKASSAANFVLELVPTLNMEKSEPA